MFTFSLGTNQETNSSDQIHDFFSSFGGTSSTAKEGSGET